MAFRKRVLGTDYPDTEQYEQHDLDALIQGRCKEAEELQMETTKRVLGERHPDTLTSMNNIAFTWKKQGRNVHLQNRILIIPIRCLLPRYLLNSRYKNPRLVPPQQVIWQLPS